MPEVQHVTPATGLARPKRMYQGAYHDDLDKDDVTPTDTTATDPAATTDPAPSNPEENVYKKRYDSLKAHYDRTVNDDRKRISDLLAQLNTISRASTAMPKSPEEFQAWRNQYPDLYSMLVMAIREETKGTEDTLSLRISQTEELARQARRDKAEAALERLHPDFPTLRMDEKFHSWVNEQPEQIRSWLYDNEDDPLLAARAIDLYKADKGIKPKDTKAPIVDVSAAARAVSVNNRVADPEASGQKIWTASEVGKLNRRDYDRFEEEIDQARREGRFAADK